jgi:cell division initiation protein
MKISPLFIKNQEFEKSMRGYNVDEVQAFLNKLASQFEEVIAENKSLQREVESLNQQVSEFRKMEKNLQDTLLKTQESFTQSIESAKKQSELIIREAEIKASQILKNAEENANEIRHSVISLREEKDLIIARLKAIVNTQANLLEGKVKDAGEEPKRPKVQDAPEKLDIDVDGIVDKLL